MSVMTASIGSTMLVASSRPPSPTSRMAISALRSAKWRNASAVSDSKKLGACGSSPVATSRCAVSSTRKYSRANSSSEISRNAKAPGASSIASVGSATRIRSVARERCGEVYSAVRNPAAAQMLASVAAVLPLPLVPAIRTAGNSFCGSPSAPPEPASAPGRTSAAQLAGQAPNQGHADVQPQRRRTCRYSSRNGASRCSRCAGRGMVCELRRLTSTFPIAPRLHCIAHIPDLHWGLSRAPRAVSSAG